VAEVVVEEAEAEAVEAAEAVEEEAAEVAEVVAEVEEAAVEEAVEEEVAEAAEEEAVVVVVEVAGAVEVVAAAGHRFPGGGTSDQVPWARRRRSSAGPTTCSPFRNRCPGCARLPVRSPAPCDPSSPTGPWSCSSGSPAPRPSTSLWTG
jgi:hypothetical protein